jgi:hypothetical protein
MKKILFVILAGLACLFALNALAANTVTPTTPVYFVQISSIDSDWDYSDTFASASDGIYVQSIQFNPAATDDELVIKDASDTGAVIMSVKCADAYDQKIKYFYGAQIKPYLDFDQGTFTAGSSVIIHLGR